jgi:beta-xylosidase
VSTGWQLVLRSKNVYGPYERKIVMDQGASAVNGPHQGAWVETKTGEHWFLHFQDKEAYGRVVHLQPMKWINGWPVIGADKDGDGKGEPVAFHKKPNTGRGTPRITPQDSEEFNSPNLGLQWQWQANPGEGWAFPTTSGHLRMFSVLRPDSIDNLWGLPNILGQKLPADQFTATARVHFKPRHENERFGLVLLGTDYAVVALQKRSDEILLTYGDCLGADRGAVESEKHSMKVADGYLYLRIRVAEKGKAAFYFSADGKDFTKLGDSFPAKPGRWVGAKLGLFMTRTNKTNDAGFTDIDWFRIDPY